MLAKYSQDMNELELDHSNKQNQFNQIKSKFTELN